MSLKLCFTIILLSTLAFQSAGQVITRYTFAANGGTFSTLSGATSPALTAGTTDEGYFNAIPIGFDFWYMGSRYTTISASTNGWLTLGEDITTATPINSLSAGGAPRPIIAPLWDDLELSAATRISYRTSGAVGSRILAVQFLNVKWNRLATGSTISFQARLYEGTGEVEFIYRQQSGAANLPSASIGISAAPVGSGNFLAVTNTGTSVSSTTEANITSKPITNNTYSFTPPKPSAPLSLLFTAVGSTTMTLNWSDLSTNETGFVIYKSTNGTTYTFESQTAADVTTSVQAGLTASTLYYWRIYAVSEGGLSTALSGSQSSTCTQPAVPGVTSPVTYCQNDVASPLSASGTGLLWGGVTGSVGGNTVLPATTYIDNTFNNKKTNFTTTAANTKIVSIDYYLPAYQAVTGLRVSIYNNSGTIINTSSTITTLNAGASVVKITNIFNYTIAAAGDYSIGVSAGSGNIGSDNPTFPLTEITENISLTGVTSAGNRCFNNVQFVTSSSATAPTPSTATVGVFTYYVSQTVSGCQSPLTPITVNVTGPAISQLPTSGLMGNYKFDGTAIDGTGNNDGILQGGPSLTTDRFNNPNSAYLFNGSSQFITTTKQYVNPVNFTIAVWFKTNTSTGGKLIGFGNNQTGTSVIYDRHIYMNNAGLIYFGVYPGTWVTINSALPYNDNIWHLATASFSAATGMALYVDGALVASNASTTTTEATTGYWKIGFDNLNGWPSKPTSNYFAGSLDDAVIYDRVLTAPEIDVVYRSADGAGNSGPVCSGSTITLTATTLPGATYSWTGPNGFTSSAQNPSFTFLPAAIGLYTLVVTSDGCSATTYTNVLGTSGTGQWSGNVSTDWADAANWCAGVVPTSATNVIIASGAVRMPSILSAVSCRNLTINSGATITTTSAGTLNIAGTLQNNGTMTNDGTTNFNGTSGQQTFSGVTIFNNLTLSNTSGLLLPNAVIVKGNVSINSGILTANNFGISVAGNWSNTSGVNGFDPGTAGVTFNGSTPQTIGGTFATSFNDLTIAGIANTVALGINANIDGNLTVSSGIFDLATFSANHVTFADIITVGNGATLKIGGTNTFPVNYLTTTLATASTVEYAGTNQTVATKTYGNLTLSSSSGAAVKGSPTSPFSIVGNLTLNKGAGTSVTFTAGTAITIGGNVSISVSTSFLGSNYIHPVGGSWTNAGTFTGNNSTISFTGSGAVVSGTGVQNFNNLTVAAPLVSFATGNITVAGNLATTGAGSIIQSSGQTLLMTGATKTISGTGISLDNLTVSGTISSGASFNITGNLDVTGTLTSTAATITMSGAAKTISGAGTKTFSSLLIAGSITTTVNFTVSTALTVNGSLSATAGIATFTGTSTLSGVANLFAIVINGTSLQLSTNSVLGVASTLTRTAGTLNVTSSIPNTVNFNGTGAQTINNIAYNNLTLSNGSTKTAAGALTINKSITIGTGTTFLPGVFTHSIYQDWNNSGTFTAGTSTIQFLGSQNTIINGATTFNVLTVNNTNATTGIILNSNVSVATLNMTLGTLLTGTNTITITSTRTGNGIIIGNIQRLHAFTTGTAYAFEGPENTVNFSSVTGVTSITVSVVQAPVTDFSFAGAINRYYTIAVPAGTYVATLRLHYEDAELNGNPEGLMGLWNYIGATWVPLNKTGNNTTSNYVELNSLTNITNRWTCSLAAAVSRWNGSVSTAWENPANWTVIQGAASTPPSSTDVAVLGVGTFTYQPTISTPVSVRNVGFGSATPVTLSLASGGSLTSGNVLGVWLVNAMHTINVNGQTMSVNGNLTLGDGVTDHAINLNVGSGNVDVTGSVTQSGSAGITFTGNGNLNIGGEYNYVSGTFTPGTGTVTYNGIANQIVGPVSYYNLSINKAGGIATLNSPTPIAGNLNVTAGELENYSTTTVLGNVTIGSGAELENLNTMHVGGNWLNNGIFTAIGAEVFFDGPGTQTISSSTFNNFTINKPVGSVAELTGNIAIKGDFTIMSGTLDVKTFDCNRTTQGGTITLAAPATFIVGANNSPLNFSNGTLDVASTVIANGVGAQLIFGADFGNLILRNGGLKTLVSPINVKGNLTIESGATFNGGTETLTLNGNWINAGTLVPSTGIVVAKGAAKTITGNTTFNQFNVTGSYTILNDVTFNGLIDIAASGSLSGGPTIHTTVNGDLINSGILYTLGTTTFTGNVLQTLSLINSVQTVAITVNFNGTVSPVLNSTSPPQYGYLNINNTGGVNPSVGWTIAYALTVGTGASFNGGPSTHTLLGSLTNNGTITTEGKFNFTPASPATLDFGVDFSSTGEVFFGGVGAMTHLGTPLSFHTVVVSNTNPAGVTPASNWLVTGDLIINSGSILHGSTFTHTVGENFASAGTLTGGTSTFLFNGTADQSIQTASAFNNLTVNKTSGVINLLSNTPVNGVLNFIDGMIYSGSHDLIQSAGGSVTGAGQTTGWVNGRLRKNIATGAPVKTFEIGDAVSYTPVATAFSSVTTSGDLTASTTIGKHPDISNSGINPLKGVNRFWTLSNGGISFTNYSATFNFTASDVDAGANTANFKVAMYSGTSWNLPTTVWANSTNIQASGITTMGDCVVGENCNAGTGISYAASPYCANAGVATVTLTGNAGGAYTGDTGLSIDSGSGAVDLNLSTPGSHVVSYYLAASAGCTEYIATTTIVITAPPAATISYPASPYCSSAITAAVILIGTSGGIFSAGPGLSIDPTTGIVDLVASTGGVYTVTYSLPSSGGCLVFSTTTSITVTTQPFATGTYEGNPYCSNGGIAFPTGSATGLAGTLTSTAGLSIDPPTGVIQLSASIPGTYTVTYRVPAYGGCALYTNTATVAITDAPVASINYTGSPYYLTGGTATVSLTGTTGGVFSSTSGISLNSTTGDVNLAFSTPDTYTVTYTIPASQGCANYSTTASISIIDIPITWDGGAGTILWSDALNWSTNIVPTLTDDVYFDGIANIEIDEPAEVKNLILNNAGIVVSMQTGNPNSTLTVTNGVTLTEGTLNSNEGILTVGGNWTNNATFNSNSGTVEFNGLFPQYLSGTSTTNFNDITLTNTSTPGVYVQSDQNLLGVLSLSSNSTLDADGSSNESVFKLISTADDPTQDAAVDVLPTGAQVTGSVAVERFMAKEGSPNTRIYRYISSPVQNAAVIDLQNEIPVTGSFSGTSICTGCLRNQSLFSYDERILTDTNGDGIETLNDGYVDFPGATHFETFIPGTGYALYVRGNILPSTLWDLHGVLNAGNVTPVTLPVSFTSSGSPENDGWNLVGNPFASTIDWNSAGGWTKTNIDGSIYFTDNGGPSIVFAYWNGTIGINGGTRYLATGQGFWVKASATPLLTANENVKAPRTQGRFIREGQSTDLLRITMLGGSVKDETAIHFRTDATPGFDRSADAWKL